MVEVNSIDNWGGEDMFPGLAYSEIKLVSERARSFLIRNRDSSALKKMDYLDVRFLPYEILPALEYHLENYIKLCESVIEERRNGFTSFTSPLVGQSLKYMQFELNAFVCVLGRLDTFLKKKLINLNSKSLFKKYLELRNKYSAKRQKDKSQVPSETLDNQSLLYTGQLYRADGTPVYQIQNEKTHESYDLDLLNEGRQLLEEIYSFYTIYLGL